MMRKISLAVFAVLIVSSCAVYPDRYYGDRYYYDRYGRAVAVEPEFYGTVTYVDPYASVIELDYLGYGGRHYRRSVYYDTRFTRWGGMRYSDLRPGERVWVRARNDGGRYRAERIWRR
jgi:hypothetical protein